MPKPTLEGRSLLIVEDEPLIVLDMTDALSCTKAAITSTNSVKHALLLVENDGLAGAILDHALSDGDSSELCVRLTERGVPFMIYSGFNHLTGPCAERAVFSESQRPHEGLIAAVNELINGAFAHAR